MQFIKLWSVQKEGGGERGCEIKLDSGQQLWGKYGM